jgi:hypothetical protein
MLRPHTLASEAAQLVRWSVSFRQACVTATVVG